MERIHLSGCIVHHSSQRVDRLLYRSNASPLTILAYKSQVIGQSYRKGSAEISLSLWSVQFGLFGKSSRPATFFLLEKDTTSTLTYRNSNVSYFPIPNTQDTIGAKGR